MLYPSIDKLLHKIDSKYKLVALASRRARELRDKKNPFIDKTVSHKHVGQALEEIMEEKVTIAQNEETLDQEQA